MRMRWIPSQGRSSANVPVTLMMLLSLLAARSTHGMGLPTRVGTSQCTPMPTNEFEVYRSGENMHPAMRFDELFPKNQYRVVVVGFYYAD